MNMQTKVVLTGDDAPLKRTLGSARDGLNQFGSEAENSFSRLKAGFAAAGAAVAAFGAVKLIGIADEASLVNARLKDVTGSIQAGAQAQAQLFQASQRLQVSYNDMAGSFSKMLPAVREMGGGANEAVRLAEILATTARLSGASSQEAAAGAQQFAQALQSGVLQGDELKSIMENNGTLTRVLADGLGVSVGELRKLGSEGKLTADKVAEALIGQYDTIQARSAELPQTVGGAWQQVENSFNSFVASSNEGTGVFAAVSAVLSSLSKVIDAVRVAFADTGTEADKLSRSNSIKEWGQAVGAAFAYVVDMGRAVWEVMVAQGRAIGALAAAAASAASGEFSQAADIMRMAVADAEASWAKIKNLASGGQGTVLNNYALGAGAEAPDTTPGAKLKSTAKGADKGKPKADKATPSLLPGLEADLAAQRAALAEAGSLLEQAKQMELGYWQQVLTTAKLGAKDREQVERKISQLRTEIAKEANQQTLELGRAELDQWRDLANAQLEGERIAAQNLRAMDEITKAEALQREIAFEEQRLQITQEYLRRKQELLAPGDVVGRQQLSNQMTLEGAQSGNRTAKLKGDLAKEQGGFSLGNVMGSMGEAATQGFAQMLSGAQNFQKGMLGIFNGIKAAFIKTVVTEPLAAQVAAWGKQLAMKMGFLGQEQAAETLASGKVIGTKMAETMAVSSGNAVQAATGAAASQASIPIVGPALALGAMAAIFAAVSAMGGKMKSASGGYDIPSGVNPVTQLHEEEMVLPKDIANPLRQQLAGGGGGGGGPTFHYHDNTGRLDEADIRRVERQLVKTLDRAYRNGVRPAR